MQIITDALRKSCTEKQLAALQALINCNGNKAKAAKELGISRSTMRKHVELVNNKVSNIDPSIENIVNIIKQNPNINGVSDMQVNEHGKIIWIKYGKREVEAIKQTTALFESLCEQLPVVKPIDFEYPDYDTDIIPWFNIGDGHLGMISYYHEVGSNFDLKIASRDLCAAMKELIDREPVCERCVIQDMGDMTHYDNNDGVTSHSGHALDYDTRYSKMIDIYGDVMRYIIEYAATKFKYVDVIINQGNHSRVNDFAASKFFSMMYSDNPRINILDNQSVFIPYRMGNTFVMSHHSDKCKPKQLAHVMATDFAEDWGESKYRYVDIGHVHHQMAVKEHPGVTVESFNQLATMDKYAHDGGWRSRSCLTVVRRSKTYGEKGRQIITLDEVRDIIDNLPAGQTAKQSRRKVYTV